MQILPKTSHIGQVRDRIAARRQLEYLYYALRDHRVRGLRTAPTAA